jgi:antirestriction protein ArdC
MGAGSTPWRRDWDAGGGHHVNLLSGRRYRGADPILLSLGLHRRRAQRPSRSAWSALPYWCGFAEARALGIVPRRGSQSVQVLRPQLLRRGAAAPAADLQGSETEGESAAAGSWIRYRPLALFHVADLVGQGLEELIERRRFCEGLGARPEPERLAAAEAVLRAWPVPVRHGGERACYRPQPDRIELPPRASFHSAAALYATWAHEAIHSTGHPARLARDLWSVPGAGGAAGSAYAREELVAELGAVLLGDRLEIGSDVCNHAAYLSHWIELLRESPRLLFQVLGEARRAADLIAPEPAEEPEPPKLCGP